MTEKQLDPIERKIGKLVTEMTGSDLSAYIKEYLSVFGVDLPSDNLIDRKVLESFRKRYGPERAGKIVQHVMLKHGGKRGDEWITPASFSRGMKWWTDKMYLEVQDKEKAEKSLAAAEESASEGWFDARQLGSKR